MLLLLWSCYRLDMYFTKWIQILVLILFFRSYTGLQPIGKLPANCSTSIPRVKFFEIVWANESTDFSRVMEIPSVPGRLAEDRLCFRWDLTRWPALRADMRESSPASTVPQMIRARVLAFSPGFSRCGPWTPNILRQAAWAGRIVPPPTVPTSREGIVQEMKRSFPSSPHGSMRVMQLLLPTFCAGSWQKGKEIEIKEGLVHFSGVDSRVGKHFFRKSWFSTEIKIEFLSKSACFAKSLL